jgi:hypothetical protein
VVQKLFIKHLLVSNSVKFAVHSLSGEIYVFIYRGPYPGNFELEIFSGTAVIVFEDESEPYMETLIVADEASETVYPGEIVTVYVKQVTLHTKDTDLFQGIWCRYFSIPNILQLQSISAW